MSREALITAGESMGAFDPTPMPDSLAMCLRCPGPGSPDTLVNKAIMPRVPG